MTKKEAKVKAVSLWAWFSKYKRGCGIFLTTVSVLAWIQHESNSRAEEKATLKLLTEISNLHTQQLSSLDKKLDKFIDKLIDNAAVDGKRDTALVAKRETLIP